ncbi:MAG: hypothetical protein JXP34_19135 [Planctomycetes bacterium]|nr:hypothetical protein [Planctomycetota bacterium]
MGSGAAVGMDGPVSTPPPYAGWLRSARILQAWAISAGLLSGAEPNPSALWELRLLGADTPARREALRAFPKRRRVRLAVVGQDGVSRARLGGFPDDRVSMVYHACADPGADTHDTQMCRLILEITSPLGVDVEVHVWQAGPSFQDYADKFRRAAEGADVVSLYQSFWGDEARAITKAIRESPSALFISPYVEHAGAATSTTPQGSACRPWEPGTIGHFVTVAPLARRNAAGTIVAPADRGPSDSEAINFIAPSYHASGAGGTCPSATVAVACALYLYAISPERPAPAAIIDLLRETSAVERSLLVFEGGFSADAIERLREQIAGLRRAPEGRQRKLDAPGVLNLYDAHRRIAAGADPP